MREEPCTCDAYRFPHRPGSHEDCEQRELSWRERRDAEDEKREENEMRNWQR